MKKENEGFISLALFPKKKIHGLTSSQTVNWRIIFFNQKSILLFRWIQQQPLLLVLPLPQVRIYL